MARSMPINRNRKRHHSENVAQNITDPVDLVIPEEYLDPELIKLFIRMRDAEIRNRKGEWILEKCRDLFCKDYECEFVDNLDSHTPGEHPRTLIIPVIEKDTPEKVMHFDPDFYVRDPGEEQIIDEICLPLPVILFNGKYICRSRYPSIMTKKDPDEPGRTHPQTIEYAEKHSNILRSMGISYIFDFTYHNECDLEDDILSSDELRNLYRSITVLKMSFPLRERYAATPYRDFVRDDAISMNYSKELLENLVEENGGILFQSLRGGYRVAYFTTLLRLSMWADGVIHKSLNYHEILFLTMGYDWYSFGYRMTASEARYWELNFLFYVLTSISSNEYSVTGLFQDFATVRPKENNFPPYSRNRRSRALVHLQTMLLGAIDKAKKYIDRYEAIVNPPPPLSNFSGLF